MTRPLRLLLSICLLCPTVSAAGDPPNWCREGLFAHVDGSYAVHRVRPLEGNKVHFIQDWPDGCPAAKPECQRKSYLIRDDRILTGHTFEAYTCAWYTPQKGNPTIGWLPTAALVPEADGSWAGSWSYGLNKLVIRSEGGGLQVDGGAIWQGVGDNVHVGEIQGPLTGSSSRRRVTDGTCIVELRQVADFLVVEDNGSCGGMNVRFNGVYHKE